MPYSRGYYPVQASNRLSFVFLFLMVLVDIIRPSASDTFLPRVVVFVRVVVSKTRMGSADEWNGSRLTDQLDQILQTQICPPKDQRQQRTPVRQLEKLALRFFLGSIRSAWLQPIVSRLRLYRPNNTRPFGSETNEFRAICYQFLESGSETSQSNLRCGSDRLCR